MRKLLLIVVGAVTALSACSPAKPVHDKAYYAAQDAERTSTLAACRNDPGEAAKDPNCINADAAQADVDRKKFWTVPTPQSRVSNPGKL